MTLTQIKKYCFRFERQKKKKGGKGRKKMEKEEKRKGIVIIRFFLEISS